MNMNTFNAEDARRISSDITTKENALQLESIITQISKLANEEKIEYRYHRTIRKAVKVELESRGFKIKERIATNQLDTSDTTITW